LQCNDQGVNKECFLTKISVLFQPANGLKRVTLLLPFHSSDGIIYENNIKEVRENIAMDNLTKLLHATDKL